MPERFGDIARVCTAHYGIVVENPKKGSHFKLKRAGCSTYPIPAHNGSKTEIDDKYIRAMCRNFNIVYEEFVAKLRGAPPPKKKDENPPPPAREGRSRAGIPAGEPHRSNGEAVAAQPKKSESEPPPPLPA